MLNRYKKSLIEAFSLLQKIKIDPIKGCEMIQDLQSLILKRIIDCETRIRQLKKEKGLIKSKFSDRNNQLPKSEATSLKSRLSKIDSDLETNHKLIWIFREVGDGIAHIYINAFDIKPLAFKQSPGFISGKKGTRFERKTLRTLKSKHPHVFIMNDLTNCLRYGDFTVAAYGRILSMLELKSGKAKNNNKGRGERQFTQGSKMMSYLKNDETNELYGKQGNFTRIEAHKDANRNCKSINRIINESKTNGCAFDKPENGLLYIVARNLGFDDALKSVNYKEKWMFEFSNNFKFQNTGNYPFTLMIDDPENLFDFYNGSFSIMVGLNYSLLERQLAKKGFILSETAESEFASAAEELNRYVFFTTDKNGIQTGYSDIFIARVFAEFLSFKWLKNEMANGSIYMFTEALKQGLISKEQNSET